MIQFEQPVYCSVEFVILFYLGRVLKKYISKERLKFQKFIAVL